MNKQPQDINLANRVLHLEDELEQVWQDNVEMYHDLRHYQGLLLLATAVAILSTVLYFLK